MTVDTTKKALSSVNQAAEIGKKFPAVVEFTLTTGSNTVQAESVTDALLSENVNVHSTSDMPVSTSRVSVCSNLGKTNGNEDTFLRAYQLSSSHESIGHNQITSSID